MNARSLTDAAIRVGLCVLISNQASPALSAQAAAQLVIESAAPDASGQTMTIRGSGFGSRPLVTLDLLPVNVQYAIDSQIVAVVPVNMMPAGKYVLTVSRGSSPAENASLQITLGASAAPTALQPALTMAASEAAARVGDRVISIQDVDREWSRTDPAAYLALARELYERRRRAADKMVADELIARESAARGLTPDALLEQELRKRTITTPDSAVLALYQTLGDRARGATLEQMRPALRAWLTRVTEPEIAKMNYVEELMKVSTRGTVLLEAPRVQVERTAEDITLGPATAPVEIVAFGDFESLEYAVLAQAFGWVHETFGDRIRLVFKYLPVTAPSSMTLAEAAACANAQGRFWPFHDAIVARTGPLDTARLKALASDTGLDRGAFDPCLDRDEFASQIRQAVAEAERYAITSSPSFLVNGRLAPAPPSFLPPREFFTRIIEEELLRQSRTAAPNR
jgi:protein-disulfide isomerase